MDDRLWTWPQVIAAILLLPPAFFVAIWIVGSVIDGAARHSEDHDRCLKAATNGYEIKQCR